MITAQDIREKTFEKSRMNGYDMASVDDFLEEVAEDISNSQKENAVLKSKMKVLVDKIEEYRANEEALNLAILSAQKLAVQIESEARQRAAAMIEDAERQVKERVGSIEELTATEERRLADAQIATKAFFEKARKVCNDQLKTLDVMSGEVGLPETEEVVVEEAVIIAEPEQVDIDEAVRNIEQEVSRAGKPEPALDLDLSDFDLSPAPKKKNLSSTQSFNL
ncbi:MAG: DivIVA domain-containing protein [Candidatus Limivicinus sp.]